METRALTATESFGETLNAFRASQASSESRLIKQFIGIGQAAADIRKKIELVAKVTTKHILITGPTGSGKSFAAKLIHRLSERRGKERFFTLNCATIPKDLVATQLFGHVAGSFTGAVSNHPGFFKMASGGTLFLDEIGEASLDVQANLLGVIETGCFFHVGGSKELHSDARVIASTNCDLASAIRDGKFRRDLYYRLYGLSLHLPALEERREDISYLAAYCVVKFEAGRGPKTRYEFKDCAITKLFSHSWPGNVRELNAVLEHAMLLSQNNIVSAKEIEFPQI